MIKVPKFIVMSGLPCTGKSEWIKLCVANDPTCFVVSADAIAYELAKEKGLSYNGAWDNHRSEIEEKIAAKASDGVKSGKTVIMDRTYLAAARRAVALKALTVDEAKAFGYKTVAVAFKPASLDVWKKRLLDRNASLPDKEISDAVITNLTKDAAYPELSEGFDAVYNVPAIGDDDWEAQFKLAADRLTLD